MKVSYSEHAREDLNNIYEYIALVLFSPENASRTAKAIMKTARSLESMPERNPLYKEEPWHSKGLRFAITNSYILFYLVNNEAQTVSIVRILYYGCNINPHLEVSELANSEK